MKKSGVKIVEASPELVKGVQERAEADHRGQWIKKATAKGVDGAKVLAEFREELKTRRRRQVTATRRGIRPLRGRRLARSRARAPPPPCCCSA